MSMQKTLHQEANDALKGIEQTISSLRKFNLEKIGEISDAIYICSVRSGTDIAQVTALLDSQSPRLDSSKFFDCADDKQDWLLNYCPDHLQPFLSLLFRVRAGIGTPTAAAGNGELFLLLLSSATKPRKGDIRHGTVKIEVKANSGQLGIGNALAANNAAVDFCKQNGLVLPTGTGKHQLAAKFPPWIQGNSFDTARAHWWRALTENAMANSPTSYSWPDLKRTLLTEFAKQCIVEPPDEQHALLVFDYAPRPSSESNETLGIRFHWFRTTKSFVDYYMKFDDSKLFYFRPYQPVKFSMYCKLVQPIHSV